MQAKLLWFNYKKPLTLSSLTMSFVHPSQTVPSQQRRLLANEKLGAEVYTISWHV